MENKRNQGDRKSYPWAELFDLESGVTQSPQTHVGAGRPRKIVKRHKTSITLTDEERRIFESLVYEFKMKIRTGKVTRNQVLGLALRLLNEQAKGLPEHVGTWVDLAGAIFEAE